MWRCEVEVDTSVAVCASRRVSQAVLFGVGMEAACFSYVLGAYVRLDFSRKTCDGWLSKTPPVHARVQNPDNPKELMVVLKT